jgi:hypothetical protein
MLSDMLDDVSVKLYFGNGQIKYGEHGVDLSEFDSVDHVIRGAALRTWDPLPSFLGHSMWMQSNMTCPLWL